MLLARHHGMPPATTSRRGFLHAVAGGASLAGASLAGASLLTSLPLAAATNPIAGTGARANPRRSLRARLILVRPRSAHPAFASAERGARLAASEAEQAAALLGHDFQLSVAEPPAIAASAGEPGMEGGEQIIIGGFDSDDVQALLAATAAASLPVLNIGSPADALRGELCDTRLFHVHPSERMYADALARWRSVNPGAAAAVPGGSSAGDPGSGNVQRGSAGTAHANPAAAAWHPALSRFGATQLNDRYESRYGAGMDSDAWCGWMAVKIAWEVIVRSRPESPVDLTRALAAPAVRFDGHKGRALTFRSWDRQLRQPVFIVGNSSPSSVRAGAGAAHGEILAQIPESGGTGRTEDVLDIIGASRPESRCRAAATG